MSSELKQRRSTKAKATTTTTSKKQKIYINKTTTLHVHHAFLYICLPSFPDYDEKVSNFKFCGGHDHKTTTFFFSPSTSIQSFRLQLQKNSPTFDELDKME